MTAHVLRFVNSAGAARVVFGRALLERLVEITAKETAISTEELRGSCRIHEVAIARFAIMYAAHEAGLSISRIAHFFNLDHTSVLHGNRRAPDLANRFSDFASLVAKLKEATE